MWNDTTIRSFRAAGAAIDTPIGAALLRFAATAGRPASRRRPCRAEPAFVGQLRTTCVATQLAAGHAENALPQTATATVNCRIFPGVAVSAVQTQLQTHCGQRR